MAYRIMDPSTLREDLRHGVVEVMFDKINGERRQMRCTLDRTMMPGGQGPHPNLEADHSKALQGPTVTVWDLDAKDWRAFRSDRIISIQAVHWG